ncbi:MAG: TRAP transporter substrate-binding protein [Candidatus Faecalibacterium intestinavium]|uniref:TRAP transporter substrate-binding protein n=1 Tax=Candidatus Faecalibacterium intestinavium TaxID=2838580 RepID=A0A9E2KIJ2_9FIRM|nr:TRAP transporter substrate-binding protein [Candidatus Faecalibacterium intestinavium]
MKRREFCLSLLGMGSLLFPGCAAAPGEDRPLLILRYADNQPEDYPTTQAAEYFARLVEERTHGKILVRVYSNGVLGDENSVFEQVQFGGVDITRLSLGTLAEYFPAAEVLQLPYLYDDADHMWRVLDGPIGDSFLARVRSVGVVGLSWFDAGARSFYTREPVTCLEDLQGLTIRVQESLFMSRVVELLGARPVQIPYGDVYSALQTAAIDGAENNWPSYESTGHFEAAPYMLRDEHSRLPELQVMSTVALDKIDAIDPDYITILRQCARECALYERELWQKREAESERVTISMESVVTELSDAERERFRQAVQPIYDGYPEEIQALIREIKES